ncbi:hypothetical protein [Archangium sp.]|uniref:hypothetical protein n=1 Tax=Archangium sp. TaxID=1872627 RepID=UPI00389AFDA0
MTLLLPALASATDVRGTLSGQTVWTRSGSPYVLQGDVTVAWGARLTLEPGVQVVAAPSDALKSGADPERVELIVDGSLVVRGTPAQPVALSSSGGDGSWYGIRVRGGRGTVIDHAVITRAHQGIALGMSAVVRNTSVRAATRDCLLVSWGTPTLEHNELNGCGKREPDARVWADARARQPLVKDSEVSAREHTVRMASLTRPPPSEPSVRGRRIVFMPASQGPRGLMVATRFSWHREQLHSTPAPLAQRPQDSRPATVRPLARTGTRVAAFRPREEALEPLRRRPWSPLAALPPLTLHSGTGGSAAGPPAVETCSREPQVLEAPECPGLRRWRQNQERLGEAMGRPGERSLEPPVPGLVERGRLTAPG